MAVKTITKKELSISKKDIDELSALYDRIYNIADRLIKKHNPCNIHIKTLPAKDLFLNPIFPEQLITRTFCNYELNGDSALCCHGCKYWDNSCTVKSLGCKLFLCQAIKNKVLRKRFEKLRDYCSRHLSFNYKNIDGWIECYSVRRYYLSKEDWLKFMREHSAE